MEDNSIQEADIWAYITKSADESTRIKIENWKQSHDFDENLFNSIVKLYDVTEKNPYEDVIDIETAKAKFFTSVEPGYKKDFNIKNYMKYAAVIVFFIAIAGIAYQNLSTHRITIETTYGEEKQITLSDGSVVWLNAVSKISYEEKSPRTIQLNGEAFFEVAKDKADPFTVETPDHVIVKALGTSFNVKAYPKNTYLETVLLTGKVEITSKTYFKEKIIMLPNDKIRIDKADGLPLKTVIENEQTVLAWREGKIRFENTTFKDIANELSNQLNVKLVFENEKIAKSKFTAVFDKSTSIKNILEVLKMSKEFNYNQNKETNEWMIE
ncbi:FecR family protein [Flavivirga algicola]|uniref:FecR family protein n=1 Tax=Flavivirga algicola TaxID=2729136 RepID=A0ABX1RW23_9FLAO|nr:FecR domain-containing protein [Flavivirga algicola]NMH86560.1 FecR family protein [Flavivirga algicola]